MHPVYLVQQAQPARRGTVQRTMDDQKEGTLTAVGDLLCGMVWANVWLGLSLGGAEND
jgi:hypothetical protein